MNDFNIIAEEGKARRGVLQTLHGKINTPAFMPVGTAGTVKGVFTDDLIKTGSEILLGNTYHLMLRPGSSEVKKFGGLHKFMNWDKPILTDSGGYQVFSLSKLRQISEEGVNFKSHIDGKNIFLSPETSMDIQTNLNSDIVMTFDECTPFPAEYQEAKSSMEMSMRWAERCHKYFYNINKNKLFGIYELKNLNRSHPITGELDDSFYCPQSRYAGLSDKDMKDAEKDGKLILLAYGDKPGYTIFSTSDNRFIAHTGLSLIHI